MVDVEMLKMALAKETASIEMYEEMMREHPNLKDLLSFLITEEEKHKKMIEKKISELTRF